MAFIVQVSSAFPAFTVSQNEITSFVKEIWKEHEPILGAVDRFHKNVAVETRSLALPLKEFKKLKGLQGRNDVWMSTALDVGQEAIQKLLKSSGLKPEDISLLATTTVTGIAAPSLDARLMNRIPFNPGMKRMPFFGLGCLGGVAALNRVHDYLKGHPDEAAILLSVELTSLTLQFDDLSIPNILSTGLFGDGGAAVLLVGDKYPLAQSSPFEIMKTHSEFFPNTDEIAGWKVVDNGFKILLTTGVADQISGLPDIVNKMLTRSGKTQKEIGFYVSHPGGPKILNQIEKVLSLTKEDLKWSWDSLARHGNMSSTSVLCVLESTLANPPKSGSHGMMLTFGPGYCAELNLLRYCR